MPGGLRQSIIREFGSIEQWRRHYVERCGKADMQQGYQTMVEWYGDKDSALRAMKHPPSREVGAAYAKRIQAIQEKLNARREDPADSFAVREVVGEYGFVMQQLYQVKKEKGLMLTVAASYRNERTKTEIDRQYGEGAAEFFASAIEAFYQARRDSSEPLDFDGQP